MIGPRRVYFVVHSHGFFEWRAHEKPPTLTGQCARECRVVSYKREPVRKHRLKRSAR